jgi:hypothetical protein
MRDRMCMKEHLIMSALECMNENRDRKAGKSDRERERKREQEGDAEPKRPILKKDMQGQESRNGKRRKG